MNKRKGILEFIKACLNNPGCNQEIAGRPSVVALIKRLCSDLYKHYGFVDIENGNRRNGSHHQLRFFLLYIDKDAMSFESIAEETFISIGKFRKNVKRYNKLALRFVVEESAINSDYAFLLSAFQKSGL